MIKKMVTVLTLACGFLFADGILVKETIKEYSVPLKYQNAGIDELDRVGTLEKQKNIKTDKANVFTTDKLTILFFKESMNDTEKEKAMLEALKKIIKTNKTNNKKAKLQLLKLLQDLENN